MIAAVIAMFLFAAIATANALVTFRILKSDYFEPSQKYTQCALIWLLPVVGAVLCYVFSREPSASRSGSYPEETGRYDGGNSGPGNAGTAFSDAGHHSD